MTCDSFLRHLLIALAALVIVLFFAKPASPWEFDEPLFFQALHHYDPIAHHPPPPGYPLFIGVGHLVRLIVASDFGALVTISYVASLAGFVLLALAFGKIAGDLTIGIAGALLFYFSPALLVHSTLPISEPGALALLAAALYVPPPWSAAFAALAVGWRPQFSIFVVPLFLTSVIMMRSWRDRIIALAIFTFVCVAWLVPLASAVGGVERLVHFESTQAGYLARHDADVSRSGWTPPGVALRFIAHPWGTKIASFPLLIITAIGAWSMRREKKCLPIAVASIVYLAFALWFMDPADGARYAIPFVLGVAFFAGVGLRRIPVPTYALVSIFAIGSIIYVSSFLSQRSSSWSPPVRAAAFAHWSQPPSAVPLYELPLWPHAQYYFRDRHPMRVNDGLAAYFDRPDVPLFIYADGVSHARDARVFQWQPSDAYSKLTRNHYRVASLIPIPPDERFRVVRGVYAPEREQEGEEWRWLDSPADLQLPHGPPRLLILRLGLPIIYPMEVNTLTISVEGEKQTLPLQRGKPVEVTIVVPDGAPIVHFEAARSFIPAAVPGSLNRDARRLAVKLYDLRVEAAGAAAEPQVAWQ